MISLKYLNLTNAKITHLPETVFNNLTSLESLYMSNNMVDKIP
ncbi:MAG: leucine-rich repeat domain-containing protein, partial [Bdellovibrionales bacterium]|nr:leucine-rich repeat domain-containing protein [Bdellovibrionales bacterium]